MESYETFDLKKDRVYTQLKDKILSGELAPGLKLPQENDYSRELGVGKVTLRSALAQLAEEHLILRIHGKGTFVAPKQEQQRNKILVIMYDYNSPTNQNFNIYSGIQAEAAVHEIPLEMCPFRIFSALSPEAARQRILESHISGILLLANYFYGTEPILPVLRAIGLPVLQVHGYREDIEHTGFSNIWLDFTEAQRLGYEYLSRCGYRRVAHIFIKKQVFRSLTLEEYRAMIEKFGMICDPRLILPCDYSRPAVFKALDILFASGVHPDAVFCGSGLYAVYVYQYLHAHGKTIPEDIGVIAMDGGAGSNYLDPPITTVDFRFLEIGHLALKMISEGLSSTPIAHEFPLQLVVRKSTRPPIGEKNKWEQKGKTFLARNDFPEKVLSGEPQ